MQPQSDPDAERSLRLPPLCATVEADDLRVRLVLASDMDGETIVDASEVESVGQAVLQLLVAARAEAKREGQQFLIVNPSPAFAARVAACGLGDAIGLAQEVELNQ